MTDTVTPRLFALLLAGFAAVPSVRAAESYDNCAGTIYSLPATITTQGTWCVRFDLSTGIKYGAAITVATNNVTLDCNDFKVGGLAGGPDTQATGILASNRRNVVVRNCSVRGFMYGIALSGDNSSGHVVEDNRLDANTFMSLLVEGDGSVVRRNLVRDTGQSTLELQGAFGIRTRAQVDVLDNVITNVVPGPYYGGEGPGIAYGVYSEDMYGNAIRGNRIRGLDGFEGGRGGRGIWVEDPGMKLIKDNDVIGAGFGVVCNGNFDHAEGNVINGATTPLLGCIDDGNSL